MTLAVARALLDTRGQDDITIKAALVREMQRLGRAYPDKGYGARFGNGCMRMIRSRTAAMATAVPCGFLPRRGWQRVYKRRCIWRSSPPR